MASRRCGGFIARVIDEHAQMVWPATIPRTARGLAELRARLARLASAAAHSVAVTVPAALVLCALPLSAATTRTVEVTLVAGAPQGGGEFTFNGYGGGSMTLTVPAGFTVVVRLRNAGTIPHSAEVVPHMATQPPIPPATPAFPGGTTAHLVTGIAPGASETFSFVAATPGTYEFACGVPGHAVAGMWDRLVISATAVAPSIAPAAAAKAVPLTVK
jgi:sulfocyanin